MLNQWFFKITDFAQGLLDGLDTLSEWPPAVIASQRQWIGKSEGMKIRFPLSNGGSIQVFTTRADTLFGVGFIGVSPSHELVQTATLLPEEQTRLAEMNVHANLPPDLARQANRIPGQGKGIHLHHVTAIHPLTGEELPIWVCDYILGDYGDGAVMGVPSHDPRDHEFAKVNGIAMRPVIHPANEDTQAGCYANDGIVANSGQYTGLSSPEARVEIMNRLVAMNQGEPQTNLRIRDWLISRQRYWGCPIPIVHCGSCGTVPVPEHQLPVILPRDVAISKRGGSPLTNLEWRHTECPNCGGKALRDPDTMDTFVDSSWYYFRYCDAHNKLQLVSPEASKWLPVDIYIGGIEHAILHLLYARMINRFLHSEGLTSSPEPFLKLVTQGMVQARTFQSPLTGKYYLPANVNVTAEGVFAPDGEKLTVGWDKMSKSKYNGVDPLEVIEEYGADAARLYTLFKAPPSNALEFEKSDVSAQVRFLHRLLALARKVSTSEFGEAKSPEADQNVTLALNTAISDVTRHLEASEFNVAVAELMKLSNTIYANPISHQVALTAVAAIAKMLSPMAPHTACEMWELIYGTENTPACLDEVSWPAVDPAALVRETVEVVLQFNGKLKGSVQIPVSILSDDTQLLSFVSATQVFTKALANRPIKRVVIPPKRNLINFVV